jgi:hypothetical protein
MSHNKCLLLIHAVLDAFAFLVQIGLGWALLSVTLPSTNPTPKYTELRELCSKSNPFPLTSDECLTDYLQAPRTQGFEVVWRSYYYESGTDPNFYQRIIDIQREGQCCGFGPPLACVPYDAETFPHSNSFSSSYVLDTPRGDSGGWSSYVGSRVKCLEGEVEPRWYAPQPYDAEESSESEACDQVIDLAEVPPRLGGCMYDLPLGTCKEQRNFDIYRGCMMTLEMQICDELAPSCIMVLGMSLVQVLSVVTACCFCWKRKMHDTFPDTLKGVPYDPFKKGEGDTDIAGALERNIHRPKHEEPGIEFIEDN